VTQRRRFVDIPASQASLDIEEPKEWVRQRYILQFSEIIKKSALPDDKLYIGSYRFFERIKLFALFTKHRGFLEEREWRAVYMRDRDHTKKLDGMLGYWIGPRRRRCPGHFQD